MRVEREEVKTLKGITLSDKDLLKIFKQIPPTASQARRLFEYLAKKSKATTGELASQCSIGNLSDVAHYVNPYLYKHGLIIGCETPPKPIINKFKEPSMQYLWSLYRVPKNRQIRTTPDRHKEAAA